MGEKMMREEVRHGDKRDGKVWEWVWESPKCVFLVKVGIRRTWHKGIHISPSMPFSPPSSPNILHSLTHSLNFMSYHKYISNSVPFV